MTPIEKAEMQQALIAQYKAAEWALFRVNDAIAKGAHLISLKAEDEALADRSVDFELTLEESAEVFKVIGDLISARMKAIEAKL